jgi:hypothetical protein
MPDDKKKTQPQDPNYVNTSQEWEMDYWSKKWGKSKEQIKACVNRVGNRTIDVARCLGV